MKKVEAILRQGDNYINGPESHLFWKHSYKVNEEVLLEDIDLVLVHILLNIYTIVLTCGNLACHIGM